MLQRGLELDLYQNSAKKYIGVGIIMMRKGNNRNGAKTYLGFGIKIVRKGNNEQLRLELINCDKVRKRLRIRS